MSIPVKLTKFQKFKRAWETKIKASSAFEQSLMKATHPMDDGPPEQKHVTAVLSKMIAHEKKQPQEVDPFEVFFQHHEKNLSNFISNLKSFVIIHQCFLNSDLGAAMASHACVQNEQKKFNSPFSIFTPEENKCTEGFKYMFRTAYGNYLTNFARVMMVENQAYIVTPVKEKDQVLAFINTPNFLAKIRMTAKLIDSIEDVCRTIGLDDKENFNPDARISVKLHALNQVRKQYLRLNIVRHVMVQVFCDMLNIYLHLQYFAQASLERVQMNASTQELANVAEMADIFQKVSGTCQKLHSNIQDYVPEVKNASKAVRFGQISSERLSQIKKTLQFDQADLNETLAQLKEIFGGDTLNEIKPSNLNLQTDNDDIKDMVQQMEQSVDDHFSMKNLQEARNSVYVTTNQERMELEKKQAALMQQNFHNRVVDQVEKLDEQFDPGMQMANQDQFEEIKLEQVNVNGVNDVLNQTSASQQPQIKDEFDFQEVTVKNIESKAEGVFGLDGIDDFDFGSGGEVNSGIGFSQLEKQPSEPQGGALIQQLNVEPELNLLEMDAGCSKPAQQSNEPLDLINMGEPRAQTFTPGQTPGMGSTPGVGLTPGNTSGLPGGFGQPGNMNQFATQQTPGMMGSNMYGMQNPMGMPGQQQQCDPFSNQGAPAQQPGTNATGGFQPNPYGQQQLQMQQQQALQQQQMMQQMIYQQTQQAIQQQMMYGGQQQQRPFGTQQF